MTEPASTWSVQYRDWAKLIGRPRWAWTLVEVAAYVVAGLAVIQFSDHSEDRYVVLVVFVYLAKATWNRWKKLHAQWSLLEQDGPLELEPGPAGLTIRGRSFARTYAGVSPRIEAAGLHTRITAGDSCPDLVPEVVATLPQIERWIRDSTPAAHSGSFVSSSEPQDRVGVATAFLFLIVALMLLVDRVHESFVGLVFVFAFCVGIWLTDPIFNAIANGRSQRDKLDFDFDDRGMTARSNGLVDLVPWNEIKAITVGHDTATITSPHSRLVVGPRAPDGGLDRLRSLAAAHQVEIKLDTEPLDMRNWTVWLVPAIVFVGSVPWLLLVFSDPWRLGTNGEAVVAMVARAAVQGGAAAVYVQLFGVVVNRCTARRHSV